MEQQQNGQILLFRKLLKSGGTNMNNLKIKNGELETVLAGVYSVTAPNTKINRAKFRLLKLIQRKAQELEEEQDEILTRYAEKDSNGEPIPGEGNMKFKLPEDKESTDKINLELKELSEESSVLVYGEYSTKIQDFMTYLDGYEEALKGREAEGIFILQEAYEEGSSAE